MYLPDKLHKAKVLITVKTYPIPSGTYYELVCTAGLFNGEKWIRIYPVPFRFLQDTESKYPKYSWIEADLKKNEKDFRPESYRFENEENADIKVLGKISTSQNWAERSKYVLREVFDSMEELIKFAKGEGRKSLATVKPKEIIDFIIEPTEREWKQKWQNQANQILMEDYDENLKAKERKLIDKLPYNFSYKFLSEGDSKPRQMQIEDWEIGALYWNCLKRAEGDEVEANKQVKKKYFEDFVHDKDTHFFVGTTKQFHLIAPNPFIIIGVYYPPLNQQLIF